MIAAYNGRKATVEQLLQEGADACAEDNRGNTALLAAIFKAEVTIAKKLMAADCDDNHQNKAGQTPVMYATLFGREELRALLIGRGADLTMQDNSGNSANSINAQL